MYYINILYSAGLTVSVRTQTLCGAERMDLKSIGRLRKENSLEVCLRLSEDGSVCRRRMGREKEECAVRKPDVKWIGVRQEKIGKKSEGKKRNR